MTGRVAAGLGGALAIASSLLLPFHTAGGYGRWIAGLFLVAAVLLSVASIDRASGFARDGRGRILRNLALLGAAGLVTGGAGLVGDVMERAFVTWEIVAVVATAVWWVALGVLGKARRVRVASLIAAALAVVAIVLHFTWEAQANAVPVRFAYVVWGPWGLVLASAPVSRPSGAA